MSCFNKVALHHVLRESNVQLVVSVDEILKTVAIAIEQCIMVLLQISITKILKKKFEYFQVSTLRITETKYNTIPVLRERLLLPCNLRQVPYCQTDPAEKKQQQQQKKVAHLS